MPLTLRNMIVLSSLTRLTWRLSQTPFRLPFGRLRTNGSVVLTIVSVFRFFALRAKKRKTKERKSTAASLSYATA
jgi:hypothetical protein